MLVNNPELKSLIWEILSNEDSPAGMVEADGKPIKTSRNQIIREHYRGRQCLLDQIRDTMEIAIIPAKSDDLVTIEWVLAKGYSLPEDKRSAGERFSTIEFEVSPASIAALKHFNKDRKRLPPGYSVKALGELETLVK